MAEDEISPEKFDKLNDKDKVQYLTGELGRSAKLLIEGHYIMTQYSDRYEDLWEGVEGLLALVRKRFPDDFKEGGKGFTCKHHKRLADHIQKWKTK
jgi:hypothetical protein